MCYWHIGPDWSCGFQAGERYLESKYGCPHHCQGEIRRATLFELYKGISRIAVASAANARNPPQLAA